jgi:hypothetical protein
MFTIPTAFHFIHQIQNWTDPDSLLDYPLTYDELRILTKEVCNTLNNEIDGKKINNGLFDVCLGDQTIELARDIFIAFSEAHDDSETSDEDTKSDSETKRGGIFKKKKTAEQELQDLRRQLKELLNK